MSAEPSHDQSSRHEMRPIVEAFTAERADLRRIGVRAVAATALGTIDTFIWRALLQAVAVGGSGVLVPVVLMGANLYAGQRIRNDLSRRVVEVGYRASERIGGEVFERLQAMPKQYFDKRSPSEVQSLVVTDVDVVRQTFCGVTERMLLNSLAVVSTFLGMAIMSPMLTLVMAGPLAVVGLSSAYGTRRNRIHDTERQSALARLVGVVHDRLSPRGVMATRHFGREDHARAQFMKEAATHSRAAMMGEALRRRVAAFSESAYSLGMLGGALLVGSRLVDGISLATFVAFFSLSARLYMPISQLPEDFMALGRGSAAVNRLKTVLRNSPRVLERRDGLQMAPRLEAAGLEMKDVRFGHSDDHPLLEEVSITVKPGQRVAIVGRSGQGKTTLLDLLMGNLDANSGRVSINGVPIDEIDRRSVAGMFAVVDQHPVVFSGTIEQNLREAAPEVVSTRLMAACRAVCLHEEIMRLPLGYDTVISAQTGLSGGQRQRLAIAKALLKSAPVLVLDEATVGLDGETLAGVLEGIRIYSRDRAVVTTSHRLGAFVGADVIYVLDGGRVVESGSHSALLQQGGTYAKAWTAHHTVEHRTRARGDEGPDSGLGLQL